MKLELLSVWIENFKSIKKMHFYLDRQIGVHLVQGINEVEPDLGSNGAGKSSIWDAICWCYFGKTPDGLRGPDLIPWGTNDKVRVSVLQQIGNKRFPITRTANPNSLQLAGKETGQEYVESRLKMNFDIFTNTLLMGQGRPLFFDLTPAAKMQLLADALDLERWERRSKEASKKASALDLELSKLEGEYSGLETHYAAVCDLLKEATAKQQKWEDERQGSIAEVEKQLTDLRKLTKKVQKRYDDADLAYDSAETEIPPLEKQVDDLYREYNKQVALCHQIEGQHDANINAINDVKAKIDTIKKTNKCPLCGSTMLNDKHKQDLKRELARLTKLVDVAPLRKQKAQVQKLKDQTTTLSNALGEFRAKSRDNRDIMDKTGPQLAEAKATIKQLEKNLKALEESDNPHRAECQTHRRKRDQLKNEIRDLDDECEIVSRKFERTSFWVKGFKDVALHLIEDVLQEIELASNVMLDQMGLSGWKLLYATEKETKAGTTKRGLNVTVLSPHNDKAVRWENWSGGEGQRLRLIGALSLGEVLLARAGIDPSMEVLDEPSQFLSTEGVEDLVEFLHDRAQALGRRIYFTEHHVMDSALFSGTVHILKSDRGSEIGKTG